jgi:hypothetical protein
VNAPTGELPGRRGAACEGRALWGWSPLPLSADTPTKRHVDRVVSRPAAWCAVVASVIVAFNLAAHIPARGALALDGVAALFADGMCSANFWRCRHAHCLITGGGWLALSIVAFAGVVVGHSLIGGWGQTAFLAILAIALTFEGAWYLARRTNAIAPASSAHRPRPR